MRFCLGPIPSHFEPNNEWRPLREPGPLLMQLCALPIGIGLVLVIGYCWHFRVPASIQFSGPQQTALALASLLLSLPVIIIVHEFIHALMHPGSGLSDSTVIGAWPSRMLFYAHYTGPLSRNRFLACLIMPFLVITVLPLLFAFVGLVPGRFLGFLVAWCSTWNAIFASGDVFGIALVLCQIPRRAIVQNDGWKTFWKPSEGAQETAKPRTES